VRFDPVLVPVDFSPASLAAIRHARALARENTVRLLHVVDASMLPHRTLIGGDLFQALHDGLVDEARGTLGELARGLASDGARVETEVRVGRPGDEIVASAREAGLVVLGSHIHGLLGRLATGSVAEEVARRSPAPVLVAREGAEGSAPVARVLVAVDLAEPAPVMVEAAAALAARLGARLEAIHVIPWQRAPWNHGANLAETLGKVDALVHHDIPLAVRAALSKVIGETRAIHIGSGSPALEIARSARPTDILVCGTHGRGAVARAILGSVATKLMRGAPCPLMIVSSTGEA
jgi:nucleotide-binding universal stress UspA family protein